MEAMSISEEEPQVVDRGVAPPRPTGPEELSFERRQAVRWFSPSTLARAGIKVVLSLVLGEYLDKRELQQSLELRLPDKRCADNDIEDDDMWIDFVADTADGFDASYSVAWCVSQRTITVDGQTLPRGDLLVLGGDQVYPFATAQEYEDRFHGPYEAALPWIDEKSVRPDPRLLAIPGNHDWYDGLTGFMRMFAQQGWVGGRKRTQTRSYFAERLPGRFWLWGVDIQNGAYLDTAQIDFFEAAAKLMREGDRLILCTAKPSWADVREDPHAYDNLAFVEKRLVPDHVTTVLMLSGDKHHYVRYEAAAPEEPKRARITAGGGGAFLSPTNKVDDKVQVPKPRSADSTVPLKTAEREQFNLCERYPSAARSRWLSLRALAVGRYNVSFMAMIAFFYLMLFSANWQSFNGIEDPPFIELMVGRGSIASWALIALMVVLLSAFFDAPKSRNKRLRTPYRVTVGAVHTAAHVAAQGVVAWIALQAQDHWGAAAMILCVIVLGGVVGSVTFGAYLIVAFTLLGRHDTETFSSFRYEGCKNFLRIHVTAKEVTVYPIGIDRICRDWVFNPHAAADSSYLAPRDGSIGMRFIEKEIVLE
ncbi:hypothetical protein BVU76_03805 [Mycolicibacterium porcinum]|nr:hypothetical protein BVU76_03805 [Mycolicibacterium porcinum]